MAYKLYDKVKVKGIAIPGVVYGTFANCLILYWEKHEEVFDGILHKNLDAPCQLVEQIACSPVES